MMYIQYFCFVASLFCTGQIVSFVKPHKPLANTEKTNKLSDKIIDSIINPQLQKTLRAMEKGQIKSPISKKEATHLLLATIDEAYTLDLLDFLVAYYKANGHTFDMHKVMIKALELAPSSVVKYLLEKGIYDKSYLSKKKHYNFLFKLDRVHRAWTFLSDSFNTNPIPRFITIIWHFISAINWGTWFFGKLFKNCENLHLWIDSKLGKIGFLFTYKTKFIQFLLHMLYTLYISNKISIKPGYLFDLFTKNFGQKSKKEIEEKAFLLLQYGAKPDAQAFFVEKQDDLTKLVRHFMKLRGLPNFLENFAFYSYFSISILHLAAQHDLLPLVKALLKDGAKINVISTSMKDTLSPPTNSSSRLLPFLFVTTKDLYNKKKGLQQTPLDLAPEGSSTARYLREQGGKYYREIQVAKKTKKRKKRKEKKT